MQAIEATTSLRLGSGLTYSLDSPQGKMLSKDKSPTRSSVNGTQEVHLPENPSVRLERDVTVEDKDAEIAALKEDLRLKAEKLTNVLSQVGLLHRDIEGLAKSKESLEGLVTTLSKELESKEETLKKEGEAVKSLSAQVTAFQVEKKRLLEKVDESQANTVELSKMVTNLQFKVSELEKEAVLIPQKNTQDTATVESDSKPLGVIEASSEANGNGEVEDVASEDIDSLVEELREKLVDVKVERAEAKERAERLSREVCKLQAKLAPWDAGDTLILSRSRSLWRELDDTQKELSQLRAERDFLARKIKSLESEDEWDRPTLLKRMFPFWDTCRSSWAQ